MGALGTSAILKIVPETATTGNGSRRGGGGGMLLSLLTSHTAAGEQSTPAVGA